jgi:probable H4MPT-linked C1 transfer pathway protein
VNDDLPSLPGSRAWLAIDIGGANLKAAHGNNTARTVSFQVWRRPDELRTAIASLAASFPPFDRVALTMTAELCDCYATKKDGVVAVLDAVEAAVLHRPVSIWGVDGRFHDGNEIRRRPELAVAANWLALAIVAARMVPEARGILIDVGSTTTDLIPLDRGNVVARGHSDMERLQTGELVYAGVRRTPVCALATELPLPNGAPAGLAAELFATTLDVFLTLGDVDPDQSDLSTADGRPATVDAARDRLARMVCADRDTFSADDALALARSAQQALMQRLVKAALRVCNETIGKPRVAVVAGSGEFLARRSAEAVLGPDRPILSLAEAWGCTGSTAGCALALLRLAAEPQIGA